MRFSAIACVLAATAAAGAQAPAGRIPLGAGATIVQTLATPGADRESVHRVRRVSDAGLHYEWMMEEVYQNGDTARQVLHYLEAWGDIAQAQRLRLFHDAKAPEAHPGYTMHALSRASYRRLREGKRDSLQIMSVDASPATPLSALGMGGGRATPVRWRGTIAAVGPGVAFPVLLNGRRVQLPAIHVRGDFSARQGRWEPEFWVLADSAYPLILKWIGAFRETGNVLQTTRIDIPSLVMPAHGAALSDGLMLVQRDGAGTAPGTGGSAASGAREGAALEGTLAASCRAELPGIYFAFNSAHLTPASDPAIATIAAILARHPDWTATLEGHTDSIGSVAANKALSEARVAAVRARLLERHKVNPARLRVEGFGSARPREPNGTIEGRARNRRVELVRDCTRTR